MSLSKKQKRSKTTASQSECMMTDTAAAAWPWMTGVETSMADPIDPVCEEDTRPAVTDLIKEYAPKIAKIKAELVDHPHYDERKHDDLWIVRFYMSQKKSKAAIDAARRTLDFRAQYKLDETDIRDKPPHQLREGKVFEFFNRCEEATIVLTHPNEKRGVIAFIKPASMDQHKLVAELTEDYWLPTFTYISEWSFQWLDYVTRTTGRLTRSVRFIDAEGMNLSRINRECLKRNAHAIGEMEDFYPQMLETVFICDPPPVVKAIWGLLRAIAPKRVLDKIDMVTPKQKEDERKRLYRHISEEDLPEKFGGKNPVPVSEWQCSK